MFLLHLRKEVQCSDGRVMNRIWVVNEVVNNIILQSLQQSVYDYAP